MGKALFSTETKFPSISVTYHGPAPRPSPKITLPAAFLRIVVHMPGSLFYTFSRRRQWKPTPVLLPGKSQGRRSLVGCSPWGHQELDTIERLHFHFSLSCTGEGNGNPLQCSCLENPRDSGAWWAAIYGVAQSRTQLKQLSSSSSSSTFSHRAAQGERWRSREFTGCSHEGTLLRDSASRGEDRREKEEDPI